MLHIHWDPCRGGRRSQNSGWQSSLKQAGGELDAVNCCSICPGRLVGVWQRGAAGSPVGPPPVPAPRALPQPFCCRTLPPAGGSALLLTPWAPFAAVCAHGALLWRMDLRFSFSKKRSPNQPTKTTTSNPRWAALLGGKGDLNCRIYEEQILPQAVKEKNKNNLFPWPVTGEMTAQQSCASTIPAAPLRPISREANWLYKFFLLMPFAFSVIHPWDASSNGGLGNRNAQNIAPTSPTTFLYWQSSCWPFYFTRKGSAHPWTKDYSKLPYCLKFLKASSWE